MYRSFKLFTVRKTFEIKEDYTERSHHVTYVTHNVYSDDHDMSVISTDKRCSMSTHVTFNHVLHDSVSYRSESLF